MHPTPSTVLLVSPHLILLYHNIFCLLCKSEFLLGLVRLQTAQNTTSLAAVTNHTTPCSTAVRLHVMKSSTVLTPVCGTDPLCKFLLTPSHLTPFPYIFSNHFRDHKKLLKRQPLGVLQLLHFRWISLGFWFYYKIINMTINQGNRERG